MLHLTGVRTVNPKYEVLGEPSVTLDDIKRFRQLDSKCPGHPEYRWTSGVETTTGPLGQGVAVSVGMAIAQRWMAAYFNRPGFALFDYDVYALCGDGDMMEGVASEAASLAGHLKLANLCWIYDNNRITIEGATDLAFSEDVAARFSAYGWQVTRVADANDLAQLRRAFAGRAAGANDAAAKPTLIIVDSHIGYGAPTKQGTSAAHGEPLGADEIRLAKRSYGWPEDAHFLVPDEVRAHFQAGIGVRGRAQRDAWFRLFEQYRTQFGELADQLYQMQHRQLPDGWDRDLPAFPPDAKGLAGREASGKVLNAIAGEVPWLIGGAADLAPSTKTRLTFDGAGDFSAANPGGRNLHFGVREHAMGAILNGLSHCKVRPYGSGFLIFSDYARPAIRLAALMELPTIYIFTHDSIGVGEDGPTHQPIEQLASLRGDSRADHVAPGGRQRSGRGLARDHAAAPRAGRAGPDPPGAADPGPRGVRLRGGCRAWRVRARRRRRTASPRCCCWPAAVKSRCVSRRYEQLEAEGIHARVVSVPSWELFEQQSQEYRDSVLPPGITARVSVEQASTFGWARFTGLQGARIGMKTFGASAPLLELQHKFGFTPDNVIAAARELVQSGSGQDA